MGGMSMIALFWGREIDVRRLLSRSAIMMLVINPYFLAYDSGFLLSYSALIGIIYFDNINKNSQEKEEKSTINPPVLRTTPPFQKEEKKLVKPVIKLLKHIYKNYLSPSI
jgi:predicted membrane metal-binding protein